MKAKQTLRTAPQLKALMFKFCKKVFNLKSPKELLGKGYIFIETDHSDGSGEFKNAQIGTIKKIKYSINDDGSESIKLYSDDAGYVFFEYDFENKIWCVFDVISDDDSEGVFMLI